MDEYKRNSIDHLKPCVEQALKDYQAGDIMAGYNILRYHANNLIQLKKEFANIVLEIINRGMPIDYRYMVLLFAIEGVYEYKFE